MTQTNVQLGFVLNVAGNNRCQEKDFNWGWHHFLPLSSRKHSEMWGYRHVYWWIGTMGKQQQFQGNMYWILQNYKFTFMYIHLLLQVCQNGLDILSLLANRLKEDFRHYIQTVLPAVIDRLGNWTLLATAFRLLFFLQIVQPNVYLIFCFIYFCRGWKGFCKRKGRRFYFKIDGMEYSAQPTIGTITASI